jgi:hypothetical protein
MTGARCAEARSEEAAPAKRRSDALASRPSSARSTSNWPRPIRYPTGGLVDDQAFDRADLVLVGAKDMPSIGIGNRAGRRSAVPIGRFDSMGESDLSMRCAGAIAWDYDRTELIADGIVHVIGVGFGSVAAETGGS